MTREFIDDIKRNMKAFTSSSDFVMEPRLLITDDITRSTMTDQEWLTSEDPVAMLEYLTDGQIVSDRKLELFCVAGDCLQCQKIWKDSVWTTAAWKAYNCASANCETPQKKANLLREIVGNPFLKVRNSKDFLLCKQCRGEGNTYHVSYPSPAFEDYDMSPMKPIPIELVTCDQCNGKRYLWKPSWLTPKVRDMAQHIYDTNEWDLMPQLGDLLEESGCDNEEILQHCRQEEQCFTCKGSREEMVSDSHGYMDYAMQCRKCQTGWIPKRAPCVRGCWVVDLLLGNN